MDKFEHSMKSASLNRNLPITKKFPIPNRAPAWRHGRAGQRRKKQESSTASRQGELGINDFVAERDYRRKVLLAHDWLKYYYLRAHWTQPATRLHLSLRRKVNFYGVVAGNYLTFTRTIKLS